MFDFIDFRVRKKGYHNNVSPCTIYPQNCQCIAKIDKHNEHTIYHFMQSIPLGTIAPKYYGLYETHDYLYLPKKDQEKRMTIDGNFNYIIMEDLTRGFKKPNFVDIKLGTRTSDVKTKIRSVDRLAYLAASTTSADFGFRVTDILDNNYDKKNPKYLPRKRIASNIYETNRFFENFFTTSQLKTIFDEIKNIRNIVVLTLHQFPGFRMYASSLFITYDSENPDESEIRIKLIDFAHVHFDVDKDGGKQSFMQYDDGVLRGLDSMIAMIGVILSKRKVPIQNQNLVDPEEKYKNDKNNAKKEDKSKDKSKSKDKDKDKEKSKDKDKDKDKDKEKSKDKEKDKDSDKFKEENNPKNDKNSDKENQEKETNETPKEKETKDKDEKESKEKVEKETKDEKEKETKYKNEKETEDKDKKEKETKNEKEKEAKYKNEKETKDKDEKESKDKDEKESKDKDEKEKESKDKDDKDIKVKSEEESNKKDIGQNREKEEFLSYDEGEEEKEEEEFMSDEKSNSESEVEGDIDLEKTKQKEQNQI